MFYLENLCTSFCLMKVYDLGCQKPFEDRFKPYPYVFHFENCLKLYQLNEANIYMWNDFLYNLIGNCTAVHSLKMILGLIVNWFFYHLRYQRQQRNRFIIFNFNLNSFIKQRFNFCYLVFRRKCSKFYRQKDNISWMNSYLLEHHLLEIWQKADLFLRCVENVNTPTLNLHITVLSVSDSEVVLTV